MSDIYTLNFSPVVKTRRPVDSFVEPIYMKEISRKSISYLGSKIWNGLEKKIKIYIYICVYIYILYIYIYMYVYIYIYIYIYICIYIYLLWKVGLSWI